MAKYWVYLNDQVKGPYEVDELIRLSGFSRRTMVSRDDHSGAAGKWTSPAEIPELARIFQKVDELHEAAPAPAPKPVKPKRHSPAHLTSVPTPAVETHWLSSAWPWLLILLALAGSGYFFWNQSAQKNKYARERQDAQSMIELAPLPSKSQYSHLRQYLQEKQLPSRWEFERTPSELYNVTLSWPSPDKSGPLPVYAFEANLQASSVRGLNTAAIRLLSEGFPPPASAKPATAPAPAAAKPAKKNQNDLFPSAINDRRVAFEQGDFSFVWESFSRRRKSEMSHSGINQTSYERMQKLTYRPGANVQQTIIKTRTDSDVDRLVLLRQSQPKHPDIYIKQRWIWEENTWRLDDEEKKAVSAAIPGPPENNASAASPSPSAPSSDAAPSSPPATRPIPAGLPGFSDLSTR